MNDAQIAAYSSLGNALGGKVIDPKYAPAHRQQQQEAALKSWVKDNWGNRKNFPSWVHDWVGKWKGEAEGEAGGDVGADGRRGEA